MGLNPNNSVGSKELAYKFDHETECHVMKLKLSKRNPLGYGNDRYVMVYNHALGYSQGNTP